jgi:SAM-dependent methyltransferase
MPPAAALSRSVVHLLVLSALLARVGGLLAQDTGPVHAAPYLPSPAATVDEMLRLGGVGPSDIVYDLGSGDGRVVIAAAKKFGARGVGVELDSRLVAASRANAERAGVADRVRFLRQDLFQTGLGEATVITLYLSPNLNLKLRPTLLGLKPGTRIVSHASDFGDWKPDERSAIRKDVRLWFVPAAVSGRWRGGIAIGPRERHIEIAFEQRYQELSASAVLDGAAAPVWEPRLRSDRLSFVIVDALDTEDEAGLYFEGKVRGNRIEGSVARGVGSARSVHSWRAEKK